MNQATPQDVTRLLVAWQDGNQQAFDDLIPLVYQELRRIAARPAGGSAPAKAWLYRAMQAGA